MKRFILFTIAFAVAVCVRAVQIARVSVVGDPDGGGEMTCVVDSDVGIASVRARVTAPDGRSVATIQSRASFSVNWLVPGTLKATFALKVDQPTLWSDETPVLYGVHVELLDATGKLLAQKTGRFAFARLEIRRDDGIYLNGQKVRLRGITSPVDVWPEEASARAAACRDVVREVKWLNANAIWCTNAVPAELLDLCDERGLYVIGGAIPAEAGRHPCVVQWQKSDGVKMLAAPVYGTLRWSLTREVRMTLAVPLLPQEGAGGLGAGLAECWAAICAAPRCVGGVLGAKEGWTAVGLGAHGRAIREIWSPVSCSLDGRTLAFRSQGRFARLDTFRYAWQALSFAEDRERVLAEGATACPPASPGGSAQAQLPALPPATQAVRITVVDARNEEVCTWCSRVPRERKVGWPVKGCTPPPGLEEAYFLAGARTNRVKNAKNRLVRGPVFDFFSPPESFLNVTWGRMADGSYRLDYKLACRANVEMLGLAFPPLKDVVAERWTGSGPDGVWGNRRQGAVYGLWRCGAEGVGFVSDIDWFEIETKAGTYRFTVAKGPTFFADRAPRGADVATSCVLPAFGPGVFVRIPGLGGEFYASDETGPSGGSTGLDFRGRRAIEGTVLVTWTPTDGSPRSGRQRYRAEGH